MTTLERLQQLARTRFGEKADALGPDTDFFDALGIDSLQALDLLTDIEDAFGVEVPDWEMQDVRTLGGLAEVIGRYGG
ncbi:MAG: acyl carrier protein [Deltaproteobacteria bacterium]|nr:MAG: acyl carrier protein [Deltaproteobacteria bacterium]